MLLSRQHTFEQESCDYVTRAMVAELNVPNAPSAHRGSNAKQFIRAAVQLIEAMKVRNVSVVSELMAQFIIGDDEIRFETSLSMVFTTPGIPEKLLEF